MFGDTVHATVILSWCAPCGAWPLIAAGLQQCKAHGFKGGPPEQDADNFGSRRTILNGQISRSPQK